MADLSIALSRNKHAQRHTSQRYTSIKLLLFRKTTRNRTARPFPQLGSPVWTTSVHSHLCTVCRKMYPLRNSYEFRVAILISATGNACFDKFCHLRIIKIYRFFRIKDWFILHMPTYSCKDRPNNTSPLVNKLCSASPVDIAIYLYLWPGQWGLTERSTRVYCDHDNVQSQLDGFFNSKVTFKPHGIHR